LNLITLAVEILSLVAILVELDTIIILTVASSYIMPGNTTIKPNSTKVPVEL